MSTGSEISVSRCPGIAVALAAWHRRGTRCVGRRAQRELPATAAALPRSARGAAVAAAQALKST